MRRTPLDLGSRGAILYQWSFQLPLLLGMVEPVLAQAQAWAQAQAQAQVLAQAQAQAQAQAWAQAQAQAQADAQAQAQAIEMQQTVRRQFEELRRSATVGPSTAANDERRAVRQLESNAQVSRDWARFNRDMTKHTIKLIHAINRDARGRR